MTKSVLLAAALAAGTIGMASIAVAQTTTVQQWNGVLGGSDPRDSENRYYDEYVLPFSTGQRVRVSATRPEGGSLDPYLEVYAPGDRTPLATDDDSGGYPNAQLEFTAPRSGNYRFRVRGYSNTSTGIYDLIVEPVVTIRTQRLQGYNSGRLDGNSPQMGNGVRYADYRITMTAGEEILLRLDSAAFDAYLYVFEAGAENAEPLASNDDSGGTLNAMVLFRAPRSATYTVRASQLSRADGDYVLRAQRLVSLIGN